MTRIDLEPIDIILLDIEGTTTPIDFVYKTLFPYVRSHLVEFLKKNGFGYGEMFLAPVTTLAL